MKLYRTYLEFELYRCNLLIFIYRIFWLLYRDKFSDQCIVDFCVIISKQMITKRIHHQYLSYWTINVNWTINVDFRIMISLCREHNNFLNVSSRLCFRLLNDVIALYVQYIHISHMLMLVNSKKNNNNKTNNSKIQKKTAVSPRNNEPRKKKLQCLQSTKAVNEILYTL